MPERSYFNLVIKNAVFMRPVAFCKRLIITLAWRLSGMKEREKMINGELYDPTDKELEQLRLNARKLSRKYNLTDEDCSEEQMQILRELLSATEELPYLQAPVYFDYGCNTFFGKFSSANFNFTCLDVCEIHIGDNVMIGPNVTLATPMHPSS